MKVGSLAGALWGLDTVVLGMAMLLSPYSSLSQSFAFAALVAAFVHDAACAIWLFLYMGLKRRLSETWKGLRTRSGLVVVFGALLGGPIGMTGYVIAINNIGAGYTAIISSLFPAFGALLAYILLKERMSIPQLGALVVAVLAVMAMGWFSAPITQHGNTVLGMIGALLTVLGWGAEGVLGDWGMTAGAVDNETAIQIRETVSALAYAAIVLPLFKAWPVALDVLPSKATLVVVLAGLAGAASYLTYYKAIDLIGAAPSMALNISYSAWAVLFAFVLQGTVPSVITIVCCVVVLGGSVFASCDWKDIFRHPSVSQE
ncbi:EamA family transporter [Bifidobacterium xylocopae]|uniref:EamA family transporter n=1 Tax=Bifidobacterium xylocopae TaxID=2493119 RepID=A0A366KCB9_9BIFI|nr:EamA family transporter [Bifidobacterium xylocopae]